MKKANKSESQQVLGRQKLSLKKVTLRDLDDFTLNAAVGGATAKTVCAATCQTVCSTLCHTC